MDTNVETAIAPIDEMRAAQAENDANYWKNRGCDWFSVDPTLYIAVRQENRRIRTVCNALVSCLYPAMLSLIEQDEIGEPVPDDTVMLSFQSVQGATDYTTAGQIRKAFAAIKPKQVDA